MLETRDNKLLDRTDARPSFRAAQSALSALNLTYKQDNCVSLTLSYKSQSKTEFFDLAPSGCSRWKNRSHTRSIEQ